MPSTDTTKSGNFRNRSINDEKKFIVGAKDSELIYPLIKIILETKIGQNLFQEFTLARHPISIYAYDDKKSHNAEVDMSLTGEDTFLNEATNTPGPGAMGSITFNAAHPQQVPSVAWSYARPELVLAHELIHAHHAIFGLMLKGHSSYEDSDGHFHCDLKEEMQTVGLGKYKNLEFTENEFRHAFNKTSKHPLKFTRRDAYSVKATISKKCE
jgi:hypothetical protein